MVVGGVRSPQVQRVPCLQPFVVISDSIDPDLSGDEVEHFEPRYGVDY